MKLIVVVVVVLVLVVVVVVLPTTRGACLQCCNNLKACPQCGAVVRSMHDESE